MQKKIVESVSRHTSIYICVSFPKMRQIVEHIKKFMTRRL